jgi:protein SCO1
MMDLFKCLGRAVVLALFCPLVAFAQVSGQQPAFFDDVGVDERLGERIPLDLLFQNEAGEPVRLGDYFEKDRPVVITMTYHDCPMLCNLVLDSFTRTLSDFAWTPGQEFEIVSISFSSNDTPELAANAKRRYVSDLGRPEAADGWHFLTGDDEAINAIASAIGFQFKWVESQQDYAHPAVLVFAGAEGQIFRYLYGLEYPQRTFRNALVETSEGRIGTTLDRVILFCFQYDPNANSYVLHAINLMKAGGALTVLIMGIFLATFWRREHRELEESFGPWDAPALS